MITKELIKKLQQIVDEHESAVEIMGEHEIMIDVFRKEGDRFVYAGFSPDVIIDHSSDGVYRILSAFAEEKM